MPSARHADPRFRLCCTPCRMIDREELSHLTGIGATATEASLSRASPIWGAREMTAAAPLRYGIEAEWRKRAMGVVPAQPKARPEGQRRKLRAIESSLCISLSGL